MGLIGLVLASLLGLFWHNNALQFLSLLRRFGTRRE
jgi:FtsH-binding integral membrane protein